MALRADPAGIKEYLASPQHPPEKKAALIAKALKSAQGQWVTDCLREVLSRETDQAILKAALKVATGRKDTALTWAARQCLDHPSGKVVAAALDALLACDPASARDDVTRLMASPEPARRAAGIIALVKVDPAEGKQALATALGSDSAPLREQCLRALARVRAPGVLEALLDHLVLEPSPAVLEICGSIMAAWAPPPGRPPLLAAMARVREISPGLADRKLAILERMLPRMEAPRGRLTASPTELILEGRPGSETPPGPAPSDLASLETRPSRASVPSPPPSPEMPPARPLTPQTRTEVSLPTPAARAPTQRTRPAVPPAGDAAAVALAIPRGIVWTMLGVGLLCVAGIIVLLAGSSEPGRRPPASEAGAMQHALGKPGQMIDVSGEVLSVASEDKLVAIRVGDGSVLTVFFEDAAALRAIEAGQSVALSGAIYRITGPQSLQVIGKALRPAGR